MSTSQYCIALAVLIVAGQLLAGCRPERDALHQAAREGDLQAIQALLDAGADVNGRTEHENTPLHLVAWRGRTEIAALLLDRGADVNARDENGWTPLHGAARRGHTKTAALLLDRGADVDARHNEDATPLHEAAVEGHAETYALLVDRGAESSARNREGQTPWRLDKSGRIWMDVVGELPRTGTRDPDRPTIMSAHHVAWIVSSDFMGWWEGHNLMRVRIGADRFLSHNDRHGYGDFQRADIVVAIYGYSRQFMSEVLYVPAGGSSSDAGLITYYRNSVRVAVYDADNPERILMLRELSASPQREGARIERAQGWSGEEKDAAGALAHRLRATLDALNL